MLVVICGLLILNYNNQFSFFCNHLGLAQVIENFGIPSSIPSCNKTGLSQLFFFFLFKMLFNGM